MRIVYTATARRHIASQIGYLVQQGAARTAKRLRARITSFIRDFLARHPKAGRYIGERGIYESWIPRTPYVVMYRLDADGDSLAVLALFHTSQDRSQFKPPIPLATPESTTKRSTLSHQRRETSTRHRPAGPTAVHVGGLRYVPGRGGALPRFHETCPSRPGVDARDKSPDQVRDGHDATTIHGGGTNK